MQNNKPKGGKRQGSGRKPGTSQTAKTYRIDNDLLEWMQTNVGNKNAFINGLVRTEKEKIPDKFVRFNPVLYDEYLKKS